MTQSRHACDVAPSLYLAEFASSLENPAQIWDHAFRHQISEASRHALLVLSTLPDTVLLADLEAAFWTFYRFRKDRFGFQTSSGDWHDALRQLDGNFIRTRAVGKDIEVSFHSPSIRDFVEGFLADSEGDAADLIGGAHFYEQYTSLWTGRGGHRYRGVDNHRGEFIRKLAKSLYGPSAKTVRTVDHAGEAIGLDRYPPSNEGRAEFVARVANDLKNAEGDRLLFAVVEDLRKLWEVGYADKEDLVGLLDVLTKRGLGGEDTVFVAAQKCLSAKLEGINDFRAVSLFANRYADALAPTEIEVVRNKFLEFADDYSVGWSDQDPDWLRQVAADLEFIGGNLGIDVERFTTLLHDQADEIEMDRATSEPEEEDRVDWEPSSSRDDVDDMFQSLRDDLESR
jgi:hypothetical protein